MCSLRYHAWCSYGSFVFPSHGFLLVITTNITIIIVSNAIPLLSFHPHYVLYLKQSYGPFVFPCHGFLSVSSTRTTSRAFSSVLSSSRASASPKKLKQLCLCISNKIALMFLVLLHRPKNAILSQKKVVVALVHVRKKKALRLHLEKRMYLQKNQEEHSDLQLPRTAGHSR